MLAFTGIVPNSPLLLPSINQDRLAEIEKTREALRELAEELYVAKPDTIVLFSEALTMHSDAFTVNVADPYVTDLSAFGDLGHQKKYHPAFAFVDELQRTARETNLSLTLNTESLLHFATTVPLEFLTAHLPDVRVVPIAPSNLSPKVHFALGSLVKEVALETTERVAIFACGDLSHALTKDSPAGKSPFGKKYDEAIKAIVQQKNSAGLLQLDTELIMGAHDAVYRQLCMLFGVLEGVDCVPHVLNYEAPFGVGYLVADLHLK